MRMPDWLSEWQVVLKLSRLQRGGLAFAAGLLPVVALSRRGMDAYARYGVDATHMQMEGLTNAASAFGNSAFLASLVVLCLYLLKRYPEYAVALGGLVVLYLVLVPGFGDTAMLASLAGIAVGGIGGWLVWFGMPKFTPPDTFGTAKWATHADIDAAGCFEDKGFWLGEFPINSQSQTIRYGGDRHLLTVAPTRAGKGVAAIIPNLLTYSGSALVIDPKGENALITVLARHKMGQSIHLVDPWDQVAHKFKLKPARFNPMDMLNADDPDIAENAMMIADALVVSEGNAEKFWDDEAKAILHGFVLYVATEKGEQEARHLARVRELLLLGSRDLKNVFERMCLSSHALVRSAGERGLQKDEKLLSNVLATAQSHTHFLDSPRIRESLSHSDFSFADLKTGPASIYLILPADRLDTFGRWLRLLIQQAITVNARNIAAKPKQPVLFMLDEMAALGKLASVEQGFGLMAGYGIQFWGIVQDLGQLERIYGQSGWQGFIANAGAIQYMGSRDEKTAEYFSKLCGKTTIYSLSTAIANTITSAAKGGSSSRTSTQTQAEAQRNLAYADELMRLPKGRQLLLIENLDPIMADKLRWYTDSRLASLGNNLQPGAARPQER